MPCLLPYSLGAAELVPHNASIQKSGWIRKESTLILFGNYWSDFLISKQEEIKNDRGSCLKKKTYWTESGEIKKLKSFVLQEFQHFSFSDEATLDLRSQTVLQPLQRILLNIADSHNHQ